MLSAAPVYSHCVRGLIVIISFEPFLSAFTKLPKAAISFVLPVRPSVRMEQLGFHWTDFYGI
jgi:hypothetical protein